jgi:general secretion pathway protein G
LTIAKVKQVWRGFTLLEMLFVLMVVGLMAGLTIPRFAGSYLLRELTAQRGDIEDQLRELPRRVRLNARPLELPADLKLLDLGDGKPPLRVPPGWDVRFTPPLEISLLGACAPTVVSISHTENEALSVSYQIARLSCEISPVAP